MLEGTNYQLGMINPFTYRGYYHDFDTGLYFLKTRYYDPMTGRFISMDDVEYIDPEVIGGANLFAYCNNNPVMNADPSGNFLISLLVGAVVSFAIDVGTQLCKNGGDFSKIDWGSAVHSSIVGGTMGAVYSLGVSILGPVFAGTATASWGTSMAMFGVSTAVSFGAGALGYSVEEWMNGRTPTFGNVMKEGGFTALKGIINYTFGGFVGSFGKVGTDDEKWKKLLETFYIKPFEFIFDFIQSKLD